MPCSLSSRIRRSRPGATSAASTSFGTACHALERAPPLNGPQAGEGLLTHAKDRQLG